MPDKTTEQQAPVPVINVVLTTKDVRDIAAEHGIDPYTAGDRALAWARYIENTARALAREQLTSVIRTNHP